MCRCVCMQLHASPEKASLHVSNQWENLMEEVELFVDPDDPSTTV